MTHACIIILVFAYTQLGVLSEWINPTYLDIGVQSQIQLQFEAESQIELPDFLLVSQESIKINAPNYIILHVKFNIILLCW